MTIVVQFPHGFTLVIKDYLLTGISLPILIPYRFCSTTCLSSFFLSVLGYLPSAFINP